MRFSCLSSVIVALAAHDARAQGTITFEVFFTEQASSLYSPMEQQMFYDGVDYWSSILTGYRDGVSRSWSLTVDAFEQPASGGSILLGTAAPTALAFSQPVADANTSNGRFILSTQGQVNLNTHPDAGEILEVVVIHEIAHALGFGTLWEDNQVYNDGEDANSNRTLDGGIPGQYLGAAALAAYQREFDSEATYIPVELDGYSGTPHGHWNEVTDNPAVENQAGFDSDPGDSDASPIVQEGLYAGEMLDDELMSAVVSGSGFLSQTSIMSFYDIGYTVIPEPSVALLAALGLGCGLRRRRS
ncbi:MAG: hypothetical protein Q7Q71_12665 [Verrucomicrobiota bacterium JB023]|nr:hypothetical protein [Verrucomicrobiota bacterium JB023]